MLILGLNEDYMMSIFLYLDYVQIGRMFQVSKYLNSLINIRFYSKLCLINLNLVVAYNHGVTKIDKEYRLKICTIERINNTLLEFKKLMDINGIYNWFVSGGMGMRYNGFKRMTYDLDIFVLDNNENLNTNLSDIIQKNDIYKQFNRDLLWWQTPIDKILETNKWIHVVDPLDHPDLYLNYGHSWSNSNYKIKVDIIYYSTLLSKFSKFDKIKFDLLISKDGIKYPSSDTLSKIKLESIYQRDYEDYYGKQKDLADYITGIVYLYLNNFF